MFWEVPDDPRASLRWSLSKLRQIINQAGKITQEGITVTLVEGRGPKREDDPAKRKPWITFVVVGGGPTGVEIAGQIAELSRRALKHNFRRLDLGEVRVLLFEGRPEILATFGDKLSGRATRELERIGVEIHVRSLVTRLDAHGVDVKGPDGSVQRYSAKTKIWAAGVTASPLAKMLTAATGVECDRSGRIKVGPNCSLPSHPEVFVVGDMMNFNDLPGVSEVALQSGLHAAHVIRKRVENGAEPTAWKYRDLGSMAAVSRRSAIMSAHGVRLSGRIAWLVWLAVHITFMTGFKNRFTALIHWFLSFVGSGRCERAIAINLDLLFAHDLRRGGGHEGSDALAQGRDGASRSKSTKDTSEIEQPSLASTKAGRG
jgi:NADH dehydrogenase